MSNPDYRPTCSCVFICQIDTQYCLHAAKLHIYLTELFRKLAIIQVVVEAALG